MTFYRVNNFWKAFSTSFLDYRNEYNKTKNNISASQAREDLLGSVQRDIEEYRGLNGSTRQEMYANERDHLLSSDRLADTAIEIARNGSKSINHCGQNHQSFAPINWLKMAPRS